MEIFSNSKSRILDETKSMSVYDRLMYHYKSKEDKVKTMQKLKEEQEKKECTWEPFLYSKIAVKKARREEKKKDQETNYFNNMMMRST